MSDPNLGGSLPFEHAIASRRSVLAGAPRWRRRWRWPGGRRPRRRPRSADFLFVQTAKGMAFDADQNRLTLNGVSPMTLFFSDRPERIAGNMTTADFVPFWSDGKDSFLSDPPNADISILEDGKLRQTVVVLQDPRLEGDNLVYTVRIISGDMPVLGEDVSVFIDVIGMPLTPVSFAGVDRERVPPRRAVALPAEPRDARKRLVLLRVSRGAVSARSPSG